MKDSQVPKLVCERVHEVGTFRSSVRTRLHVTSAAQMTPPIDPPLILLPFRTWECGNSILMTDDDRGTGQDDRNEQQNTQLSQGTTLGVVKVAFGAFLLRLQEIGAVILS